MATIRIGTRPSPLAVKQAEEIISLLPAGNFEIVKIETSGDKDKITSLSHAEGSDFFTREIEDALLSGEIDAAVHSAKDIEENIPEALAIAATTPSVSPYECLVSRNGLSLAGLPEDAVVGTSSRARKEALKAFRPDLKVKDIRGDIGERLKQLDEGIFDAIIVAHAALIRLALEDRIAEIISEKIMRPHPLQGRLAVQIRADRKDLANIFEVLNEH
jgi:hydroxymethylbilane synthase